MQSVLGALLNAIYRGTPQEVSPLPNQLRAPKDSTFATKARHQPLRIARSFSDQSPKTVKKNPDSVNEKRKPLRTPKSASASSAEKKRTELSKGKDVGEDTKPKERSSSLHSHRRSRSMVPIITIDFFGSTENLRPNSADFLKIEPRIKGTVVPLPKPLVTSPASPTSTSSNGSTSTCHTTAEKEKHTFRLFKPWGKDKPKGVSLKRSRSSPQLCHGPLLPAVACHRQVGSDGDRTLKELPEKARPQTPKTHKTLRKMSSAPGRESKAFWV